MSKFYCSTHNKYKAIPRQTYTPHQRVQYIRKGGGGHPATTAMGTVEVVLGNDVYVLADSSKRIKLVNSLESITPVSYTHLTLPTNREV